MKLTEKSMEVFQVIKNNGGRIEIDKVCEAVGRPLRSVNANVTDLCSEKKGLAVREKVEVEGTDKPVTFVALTEAGMEFVPSED